MDSRILLTYFAFGCGLGFGLYRKVSFAIELAPQYMVPWVPFGFYSIIQAIKLVSIH